MGGYAGKRNIQLLRYAVRQTAQVWICPEVHRGAELVVWRYAEQRTDQCGSTQVRHRRAADTRRPCLVKLQT